MNPINFYPAYDTVTTETFKGSKINDTGKPNESLLFRFQTDM